MKSGEDEKRISFWEFMKGWPQGRGFERPLDALRTLSNSDSADEHLKEAATAVFWYSYSHSDPDSERLNE